MFVLHQNQTEPNKLRTDTSVGEGGTLDFIWQGWSKDFLGFEIFDSGIFWVGKFGKNIFG